MILTLIINNTLYKNGYLIETIIVGDSMILVLIEDRAFLTRIVSYLDEINLPYTTDLEAEYEILVIAECSNKVKKFIQERNTQKIIFFTALEESRILKYSKKQTKTGKNYLLHLQQLCNKCTRIVVTMPSIASLLKKKTKREILILPRELPAINISKSNKDIFDKFHLSKRNKKVLIMDLYYEYLEEVSLLALKYPKCQFVLIGYQVEYLLSSKNKERLHTLPNNVVKQKYLDFNLYSDLCKIAWLVIYFHHADFNMHYLDITLLFKKQLLLENDLYYQDYFINSKNAYLFQSKEELLLRFKKIIEERVANLTDNGYELIVKNSHKEILKKCSQILTF